MDNTAEFRTESWTDKDGERRIARPDYLARSGRKDGFLRSKLAEKDGNPLRGFRMRRESAK
jgi:hypothetical protein